nr:reverse transcriptase domain-containing protein [Tanacetum cinerariifolium]
GEIKAVTTRSGLAYEGPSIPTESPLEKVDEQNTEEILDKDHSNSSGSTAQIQPLVVPISIPEPYVLRTQSKPSIPYLSRLNDQKLLEKATNQMEKFFQIFHDLHFDISFADALLLMPKFASTIKSLLANKDKLFELAKVSLNENCSDMLLKKLPEKLGDPGKFLIPCDFPGMEVCHALADLGASINFMPLSIWKKLSLPELTPNRMTLELADKSITRPKGVAEDVFVKVGKFHFPTDFVVVDFEAYPRVPLILRRSFLKTGRALIDVYGEEITLRVNEESITINLNQTMRYSSTCDDTLVNRGDVIDVVYEDFMQDVLDFQYNPKSSSPTLVSDDLISESDSSKVPIVKSSSPTLTPFGESDFFLEEIEDFLNDDSIPTRIENYAYDPEGDILFLVKLLNEDPFQLPPMDLKVAEESKEKSSIEEPPKLELKELPSHLDWDYGANACVSVGEQKKDGIFIIQDKYVAEILRKFGLSEGKSASTLIDAEKPLLKDSDGKDVDVHTYRSMIGSLMYLTSSRPDIMFAVYACARFQVNPKLLHLNAVKRIFRYLKGKPCLGLWYLKDSPFDLVAYSECDYIGASLDKKSTSGGCQFLGCGLISWQCKKQTIVATSSTEAEYVAAASGYT